jgi:hypothetical protein
MIDGVDQIDFLSWENQKISKRGFPVFVAIASKQ